MWVGMADVVDEVHEVLGGQEGNGGNGNAVHARLQWTAAMSGFVLRRFADLVAEGVRTDKGFKDVHHTRKKHLCLVKLDILHPVFTTSSGLAQQALPPS